MILVDYSPGKTKNEYDADHLSPKEDWIMNNLDQYLIINI